MEDINYTLHIILLSLSILIVFTICFYAVKSNDKKDKKTFYLMCLNKKQRQMQARKGK